MRFKIDWASLIVGKKFTVFALFCFVFKGNFQVQPPRVGGLYSEGRFNGGFFALRVWGAYIWRGLFSEFSGISHHLKLLSIQTNRLEKKAIKSFNIDHKIQMKMDNI